MLCVVIFICIFSYCYNFIELNYYLNVVGVLVNFSFVVVLICFVFVVNFFIICEFVLFMLNVCFFVLNGFIFFCVCCLFCVSVSLNFLRMFFFEL